MPGALGVTVAWKVTASLNTDGLLPAVRFSETVASLRIASSITARLVLNRESPLYVAVMWCTPSVVNVAWMLAWPVAPLTAAAPRSVLVVVSKKSTVPDTWPLPKK